MSDLKTRLKKRWDMTAEGIQNDLHFSPELAIYRLGDDLFGRLGAKKVSDFFHDKKEKYIQKYISETIQETIGRYKNCSSKGVKEENAPIWVCWWTGLETAPVIVQQCVKSIYKHAGKHPVNLVTKDTYRDFLEVPDFILNKMEKGQIGLAHFADYMRISLLNQFGGLWLDATIFCSTEIPEQFFSVPFFTCKSPYRESRYLSHYEWVTFVLGGWKGNVFYSFLQEAFEAYWKKAECAIDYLFFDDMIYLAREHIPAIKMEMDSLKTNTPHRDDLQTAFNAALPASELKNVIQQDTPIYKLSWRESYLAEMNGEKTVYGYFIEGKWND